jgi:hypothetical protein
MSIKNNQIVDHEQLKLYDASSIKNDVSNLQLMNENDRLETEYEIN